MTLGAAFDNAEVPAADPNVTAGLFAFRGLGSPAELETHAQATVDAGHELHGNLNITFAHAFLTHFSRISQTEPPRAPPATRRHPAGWYAPHRGLCLWNADRDIN